MLLKWTRKGKTSIQSEETLTADFAPYVMSVLGLNIKCDIDDSLRNRKGKALISFPSLEMAQRAVVDCENGKIKCNGTIQYHPSYCELVKSHDEEVESLPPIEEINPGM